MKKTFENIFKSLLVLAVFITTFTPVNAETKVEENVIVDGDFELGGKAWNQRNKGEIAKGVSYGEGNYAGVVPSTAISGNKANGFIGQVIPLEPHTDYHVSAYVKVDVEGADAVFTGRWWNANKQGNVIEYKGASVDQAVTQTEWTKVEYRFNSEENQGALIQLVKWSEKEETKKSNAYIDQVVVTKGETKAPEVTEPEEKPQETYKEVWRDEFDQDTLNMDDWGYELGMIRGTEHQHYVADEENVFLRDGHLVLRATDRAKEDQYDHPRDPSRRVKYNSGSIRTHGKREFLYGRLEIRAKLPKGKAVFPAFWTLGADFTLDGKINGQQGHGWPITGEIDIMELIGGEVDGDWNNRTVYQTIHYGPSEENVGKFSGNGTSYSIPKGNFNDDFHTFAFDWHEDRMDWYVDDKLVRTVPYAEDPMAKDIFSKPQYIQLNLAMGGAWPGHVGDGLAGTEFVVDYVSYSQTKEQEEAAAKYYETAPYIKGIAPLTMHRGEAFNPLTNLSTIDDYFIDFSIEDSPMFDHHGGNKNVQLRVAGKEEMDQISKLPAGTYNIHYSALPKGVTLSEDRAAKVARKSTTLTILPNTLDETITYTVKKGTALKDIQLPDGWHWLEPETIVSEDQKFEAYFEAVSHGETAFVQVNIEKVNYDILDAKIEDAKALITDNSFTVESRELLAKSVELIELIRKTEMTQVQVDKSVEYLDFVLTRLEKEVQSSIPDEETSTSEKPFEEKPNVEKSPNEILSKPDNEAKKDIQGKEKLPQTGMSIVPPLHRFGLSFLLIGFIAILNKKK